jgi:ABC-type anion transport system duplicated permease subunit
MKIMRKNLIGIANLHISTIFLLNAGTVPTMCYIFFHFIIGYEKNPAELIRQLQSDHTTGVKCCDVIC